jgi:hypothetical protein
MTLNFQLSAQSPIESGAMCHTEYVSLNTSTRCQCMRHMHAYATSSNGTRDNHQPLFLESDGHEERNKVHTCSTKPTCRLARLVSFSPLKVGDPFIVRALHTHITQSGNLTRLYFCCHYASGDEGCQRMGWIKSGHVYPMQSVSGHFESGRSAYVGALPPRMLSSVVFPDPEGPMSASTSPG